MSNILESVILGLIQGITEFLPISSSGHLIATREIFGFSMAESLFFDIMIHVATALAVIVYFRKDIWRILKTFGNLIIRKEVRSEDKNLFWAIIIGTIPAAILGLLFKDFIEGFLRSAWVVIFALILGSILFLIAEHLADQCRKLSVKKSFIIGFFQALALIPGMSRSGSTISGGLIFGLKREEAARFSFLLALPIILGTGFLEMFSNWSTFSSGGEISQGIIWGSLTAFISGIISIHYLLKFLRQNSLLTFVFYRIALAAILFILLI